MPFEKGKSGNPKGRPSGTKQNARRLGANRLKKLLSTLEPLADESIIVAAEIMNDEKASQSSRLKAATTLLNKYVELTGEVFFEQLPKDEKESAKSQRQDSDDDDDEEDQEPTGLAMFSDKKK